MKHARRATPVIAAAALSLLLAACSSAGGTAPPSDVPASSAPPAASADPGATGGGEPAEPGGPELVEPQPGQQNVVSIPLERLEATADGTAVTVDASWTSGVAPCSVLDQVQVDVGDGTIDVTIREGTSDPNAMCVMIAQAKHTIFTVDVPSAGTWTIRDSQGGAAPIEVTAG
jgi:hypothetical protein